MRAVRLKEFGGPELLQVTNLPDLSPGPGQFLVRIEAAGVNPVDTYIRSGSYARKPSLPFTPGIDGAGTIVHAPSGSAELRTGQRVYVAGSLSGTYAELAVCDASQIYPLPERLSFLQGAALGVPYVTAHYALFARGGALAGETLLVHGASGGVGIATVQLAHLAGLKVFGTAGSDEGGKLVLAQGAHAAFDHNDPNYLAEIAAAAGRSGIDLIVEMAANINLSKDLGLLAQRGRVVVVGSRGAIEINPRDVMSRNADLRGVMLFGAPPEVLKRIHAALHPLLENGSLTPIVGREFPLTDAAGAHRAVMEPGAHGKIVLIP